MGQSYASEFGDEGLGSGHRREEGRSREEDPASERDSLISDRLPLPATGSHAASPRDTPPSPRCYPLADLLGGCAPWETKKAHTKIFRVVVPIAWALTIFRPCAAFRIKKLMGQGAFGCVVAGEDAVTGLKVAIKKVKSCTSDRTAAKRLLRELRFLRELRGCGNIVSLQDVVVRGSGGHMDTYIVTDLMVLLPLLFLLLPSSPLNPPNSVVPVKAAGQAVEMEAMASRRPWPSCREACEKTLNRPCTTHKTQFCRRPTWSKS